VNSDAPEGQAVPAPLCHVNLATNPVISHK